MQYGFAATFLGRSSLCALGVSGLCVLLFFVFGGSCLSYLLFQLLDFRTGFLCNLFVRLCFFDLANSTFDGCVGLLQNICGLLLGLVEHLFLLLFEFAYLFFVEGDTLLQMLFARADVLAFVLPVPFVAGYIL